MNRRRRSIVLLLFCVLLAGVVTGCNSGAPKSYQTMEDFEQAKIGVLTGSSFDLLAKEFFPEAEKVYYMNITDLILNLKQGKIDGILMDKGFYTPLKWEEEGLSCIEMDMPKTEYAVAFPNNEEAEVLKEQIDEFIQKQAESGGLKEMENKWFSDAEPDGTPDMSHLTGENGMLRVATTVENKPFVYLKDGQCTGFGIDLIIRFAEEYGYELELDIMDFGALLPSLSVGRYDLAISSITVTEERKESVLFSDVYYSSPIVMAVQAEALEADAERTLEDFAEAKIGIITGSAHDGTAKRVFPDAERVYFNAIADMVLAVEQGKIDCYIEDSPFLTALVWEGNNLMQVEEPVARMNNGFVFPQTENSRPLREEVNAFLAEVKADGTIDRLKEKWMGSTEPTEHPDYSALSGENGTIRLAVCVDGKPLLYKYKDRCTGFEIELLTLFGQQYGYALEIEEVPFESILAGISAEKYDMAAATLNITPEREESVDFSDPYSEFDVVLVTKDTEGVREQKIKTLDDLENGTIAILTGSIYDGIAAKKFPNAERKYYSAHADMIVSLQQGKADAILEDRTIYTSMRWEKAPVIALDEPVGSNESGFIFSKDDYDQELLDQINAFIAASKEDGTIEALGETWLSDSEPTEHPDYSKLSGENGTLVIAVANSLKPLAYRKGTAYTGYEVDFLTRFAQTYGYKLSFEGMDFDALIPAVASGKCDIGAAGLSITPERAQSVTYSDPHLVTEGVAIVCQGGVQTGENDFFDRVAESFEKTFIREDRWKLIVEGVGVTMLISICAAVAGSLLGFGLYMLSRSDLTLPRTLAKGIAKVYSRIVAGTPIVVILMILFYVVFGHFRDISGILVAIIGFSLTFGAFVYDHMTVSVNSVDQGQTEAAYALGYTKNKSFFRIVFPQAMSIFLPSYCGQAVELIKATAVVGYIAVNDLTKMGDIIRSNTYEAFFPLIATAVLYFLLTWIISLLLGLVKVRFEPKRRSKEDILKGVKTV